MWLYLAELSQLQEERSTTGLVQGYQCYQCYQCYQYSGAAKASNLIAQSSCVVDVTRGPQRGGGTYSMEANLTGPLPTEQWWTVPLCVQSHTDLYVCERMSQCKQLMSCRMEDGSEAVSEAPFVIPHYHY